MSNRNLWINKYTGKTRISKTRPMGDGWLPVVNDNRVTGSEYQPYSISAGSPEWVRAANKLLADHARSNFEVK